MLMCIVSIGVGEQLAKYLEKNPRVAKAIVRKGMLAAEAREAARKAKDQMRARKDALSAVAAYPENCVTASARRWKSCELYLVEGDSAVRFGRRWTDARLPSDPATSR